MLRKMSLWADISANADSSKETHVDREKTPDMNRLEKRIHSYHTQPDSVLVEGLVQVFEHTIVYVVNNGVWVKKLFIHRGKGCELTRYWCVRMRAGVQV